MGLFQKIKNLFVKPVKIGKFAGTELLIRSKGSSKIALGKPLVVPEGYICFLVYAEKVCDRFISGEHKLSIENLPILTRNAKLNVPNKKGKYKNSFYADIYFLNLNEIKDKPFASVEGIYIKKDKQFLGSTCFVKGKYTFTLKDPQLFLDALLKVYGLINTTLAERQLDIWTGTLVDRKVQKNKPTIEELYERDNSCFDGLIEYLNKNMRDVGVEYSSVLVEQTILPKKVYKSVQLKFDENVEVDKRKQSQLDNNQPQLENNSDLLGNNQPQLKNAEPNNDAPNPNGRWYDKNYGWSANDYQNGYQNLQYSGNDSMGNSVASDDQPKNQADSDTQGNQAIAEFEDNQFADDNQQNIDDSSYQQKNSTSRMFDFSNDIPAFGDLQNAYNKNSGQNTVVNSDLQKVQDNINQNGVSGQSIDNFSNNQNGGVLREDERQVENTSQSQRLEKMVENSSEPVDDDYFMDNEQTDDIPQPNESLEQLQSRVAYKKCKNCGSINPKSAVVCFNCQSGFKKICEKCGTEIDNGDFVCPNCKSIVI